MIKLHGQNGWSERDANMFILGFIACQAQESKEEGLFPDLTLQEVIELMVINYTNEVKKGE